jgi:tetratricopeptide (TPR) repeat protein
MSDHAMTDFDSERDPVDVLAEEFAERCRRGEMPSVDEYAAKYPEWAEQLRDLLPPVAKMEQLKRLRQAVRSTVANDGTPKLEQLGDYRILREVGRGGMGIVYEAIQESLGRRVALKLLPRHSLLDPKKLERFQREAQAAARLHHSNIVPVFGAGEHEGLHYYVMQFIEGQGLDEVIALWRRQRPPAGATPQAGSATAIISLGETVEVGGAPAGERHWRRVARIGVQVAQALDYAHQQGTLHRDIKPANLLLDPHGTVWITDFGLAKLTAQENLTSTGDIVGTLNYLAPEVLRGQADCRSDIYSLGLTLYELLTLERPFGESNPSELIRQVAEGEPRPPRKLNPAIPRDLETIVLKAMARAPGHRYPTAGELADDLKRFLEDRPIQARRVREIERLWRWCRRNRALAGLGAMAVASLILAAIVGWAGYVSTSRALDREAARSAEAKSATLRAESNEKLSLEAFEEIFNNMSRREPGMPFGRPPGNGPFPLPFGPINADETALLQSVLKFYDRFAEQNATNPRLQQEAARAHRRVGELHQQLGHAAEADDAYRRAARIYETLAGEFPDRSEYRFELADTYTRIVPGRSSAGSLDEGEKRLRRALALATELAVESPGDPGFTALQARIHGHLGGVLQSQGRDREAEDAYRQAVKLEQERARQFPGPGHERVDLARARQALAEFLARRDRLSEARSLLEGSIADLQAFGKSQPGGPAQGPGGPRPQPGGPPPSFHERVLTTHYEGLADVLNRLGEPMLAAAASRKATELKAKARPFGPPGGGPRPGPMPLGQPPS